MLQHAIDATTGAAGVDDVVVVLGSHADEIAGRVQLGRARMVSCEDWAEGLAASLRAGVAAVSSADEVVVVLGDQPRITAALIERLVAAAGPGCVAARAAYAGEPGHPVLLRGDVLARVGELRGDTGARELLAAVDVLLVEVGDLGEVADVDDPAQLDAMRG